MVFQRIAVSIDRHLTDQVVQVLTALDIDDVVQVVAEHHHLTDPLLGHDDRCGPGRAIAGDRDVAKIGIAGLHVGDDHDLGRRAGRGSDREEKSSRHERGAQQGHEFNSQEVFDGAGQIPGYPRKILLGIRVRFRDRIHPVRDVYV